MRILSIVHEMGPGGTERCVQNCSLLYRAHGHDTAVLAYERGGSRADALRSEGIPVFVGDGKTDDALEEAAGWRPEFLHLHRQGYAHPQTGNIVRRLKNAAGDRLPVIETSHFSRADRSADRDLIDVHIHLSRWCLWKWKQWCRGLTPPPIGVVLPHMTDAARFHPVAPEDRERRRRELELPEDAVLFGRLGQPHMPSWSRVALDAFARAAAVDPRVHLLLIGLPSPLQPHVESLPAPVRARVRVRPFVHGDDELRGFYSSLDCFLHASQCGESFGLVLVESMLCGTPVITLSTPVRGNSQVEVVGHERGGLVVNDAATMAEAMHRVASDPALRARLAAQGRAWCLDEYAMDRVGPRLLRLIDLVATQDDRSTLRSELECDGFPLDVGNADVETLMRQSLGRVRRVDRALLRLSHIPWIHRGLVRTKDLQRRLRRAR